MIHDKKEFGIGLALIAAFLLVLVGIFSPVYEGGRNSLDYLDSAFNSISKNSAYYIPGVMTKATRHNNSIVSLNIKAADAGQVARMEKLLSATGAAVIVDGTKLSVSGDLGRMLGAVLADADLMFKNSGKAVADKYGFDERRVLYDWHQALAAMAKDLTRQSKFAEARMLRDVQTKAVEPAYNYYGVEAIPMSSMIWVAMAALIGYVLYTVWYGFAVLYLFEGWGLKLDH